MSGLTPERFRDAFTRPLEEFYSRLLGRSVRDDEFRFFREQGEALGFGSVFSGPLVRSSYRADEQKHAADTGLGAVAY